MKETGKEVALIHCPYPGCERVFSAVAHLKTHEFSHVNTKPNKCPHCSKSYSQARRLESHLLTHVSEHFLSLSRPTVHNGSNASLEAVARNSRKRLT